MTTLDEATFARLADAELTALEAAVGLALDEIGLDYDSEIVQGGILNIELDDGNKVVINAHAAMREIWLASRLGAHHFRPEGGQWVDTRAAGELWQTLAQTLTTLAGQSVVLERT